MLLFTFIVVLLFSFSPSLCGVTRTDLPEISSLGEDKLLETTSNGNSARWGFGIGQTISGATNLASSLTGSVTSGIKDVATNAIDKAKETATNAASGAANAIDKAKETAANAASGAANAIDKAKETVSNGAASVIDKAKETATNAASGAASAIDKAKETAANAASGAASAIDKAKETASNSVSGAFEAAKGVASGAIDKVKDVAGSVVDLALRATEKAINAGVDFFLKSYKTVVKTLNMDEMVLPPVLSAPYFVATFKANNGFFKSLSSLSKDGDITIRRNGTTISLLVPLRFDDMEAGYNNYSVSLGWLGAEGSLLVAVKTNKVRLGLSLSLSTKCALSLDEITIGDLEGIDIKFTGVCNYCEWMISKATTFMTNFFQSTIKDMIQDKLHSTMNSVLSENSAICGKFLTG